MSPSGPNSPQRKRPTQRGSMLIADQREQWGGGLASELEGKGTAGNGKIYTVTFCYGAGNLGKQKRHEGPKDQESENVGQNRLRGKK